MLSSAAEIEQERIQVTDEERGTFKDKRLDPNNQGCWYCLKQCHIVNALIGRSTRILCKHFLAVFRYCKGWGANC